jgi:tRNA dimethylallyltransferase
MEKVLILSGQTGVGKTDLGVELAKKYNGEIVSFDSRQVYKYLDIITGKDFDSSIPPQTKIIHEKKYLQFFIDNIPVWLYDLYDPKEVVNAFDFVQTAKIVINDVHKRNKLPIIVGGTMFYIQGFLQGFEEQGTVQDWNLRNELENQDVAFLQNMLLDLNPDRLERMNNSDRNNKRRLIRAIEIAENKKKDIGELAEPLDKNNYDVLHLGLIAKDEILKRRIIARVQKRLKQGAIQEVQSLLDHGYTFDDPGLNTNGYKQLKEYFEKKMTLEDAVHYWERGEIDHARRQKVFLNKMKNVFKIGENEVEENGNSSQLIEKAQEIVYKWR